jgi:hypothetical protein
MATPLPDPRKHALDALERRFATAKVELDQADKSNFRPYTQKDLSNPSTPSQLAGSQKGMYMEVSL